MKRSELVRELVAAAACYTATARSTIFYLNPANGKKQPVPRHVEIEKQLAKHIKRHLAVP